MPDKPKHSFLRALFSVLAAFLGVQANKHAQEDFKQTSPWVFVLIGIALVLLLIITLATIVNIVLR